MTSGTVNIKELLAGALMLLLGAGAAFQSAQYEIGSLSHMGPGFFPLCLGVALAAIGATILLAALRARLLHVPIRFSAQWRGWFCILAGLAAFAVLGETAGILPATFATVFIAALGDRDNSLRTAFLAAAAMTLIAFVVFWWLLQIQLPLIQLPVFHRG
jgi:putative tricarboxylic transport membrane protein